MLFRSPSFLADDAQDVFGADGLLVVVANNVPHHNAVMRSEHFYLFAGYLPMRRAKQIARYVLGCFCDVIEIVCVSRGKSFDVVEAMIACAVSPGYDLVVELRVTHNVFAYTKKSGFYTVFVQQVEQDGCEFRNGAIVESEVNHFRR